MATFVYEVSPYRRKDGTYLVKIRMTHNREVVRKPSTIYVKREQLTRDLAKIKDSSVLDSVNMQLDKLRKAEASIEGSEFYRCTDLWNAIVSRLEEEHGFRLDFFEYAESKMVSMEPKTAEGYTSSLNALRRFTGRKTIDVNEITYPMLCSFKAWIEKANGKGCRAASYYLSCLRHIHKLARDEFNDDDMDIVRIPRQPFKKGLIPQQPVTKHRTLTLEQVKALAACDGLGKRASLARDVFMLSFCLVGMNTIDLFHMDRSEIANGILTYNRRKTDSVRPDNALMKVRLEPEAVALMEAHRGRKKYLDFADRYCDNHGFNQNVNIGLKEVGERIGVKGLNTYYARHTWSTLAMNACGFDLDTVQQSLNHARRGADRITGIYIERDFSRVWEANRAVLDLVFK